MNTKKSLLLVTLLFTVVILHAQRFSYVNNLTFPQGVSATTIPIFDADNDGDLDVLYSVRFEALAPLMFMNNGDGSFEMNPISAFSDIEKFFSIDIADMDNDDDIDFLAFYETTAGLRYFHLFLNNGTGTFYKSIDFMEGSGKNPQNIMSPVISTADIDNDGDQDIFVSYSDNPHKLGKIINHGNLNLEYIPIDDIPGIIGGSIEWADYDKDADLDFLITGTTGSINNDHFTKVYDNDGNGQFSEHKYGIVSFQPVSMGNATWGDYNNDGSIDFIANGYRTTWTPNDIPYFIRYDNNGDGSFGNANAIKGRAMYSTTRMADFNNDGNLDIYCTGDYEMKLLDGVHISTKWWGYEISYLSTGDGQGFFNFEEKLANLIDLYKGTICAGDMDNDGDLDIFLSGIYYNDESSNSLKVTDYYFRMYQNDTGTANLPPTAPIIHESEPIGSSVNINWERGNDTETPFMGLSYNIYLTTSDGDIIVQPYSDIATGYRRIVEIGNMTQDTAYQIRNLKPGDYIWGVQAIDHAFAGSEFSEPDTFHISPTADFSYPDTICTNVEALFEYSGNASDNATYNWSFEDATIVSGSGKGPYVLIWDSAGTFNVSLKVTEQNGDTSITAVIPIVVNGSADFSITVNPEMCINIEDTIIYQGETGGGLVYTWDFDDGSATPGSGTDPQIISWDTTGIMDISLIVDNGLCKRTISKSILVSQIPTSTFNIPFNFCAGIEQILSYTGNATPTGSYQWNYDGANALPGNGQGPHDIFWSSPGTKTVSLYVSENSCSSDTTKIIVEVYPIPSSDFTVDPNSLYAGGTKPSTITYTGSALHDAIYNWDFAGGAAVPPTGQGPHEVTWDEAGEKEVELFVTENGCTSDTSVLTVEVYPQEICMVTVDIFSGKNMVIWEKLNNAGIASYNIYRETNITASYDLIGSVSQDELSIFVDLTSEPSRRSYRYKISNVDSSGVESAKSPYHKSMLLSASVGIGVINLSWEEYKYEGGDFTFESYIIYRSQDSTILEELETVPTSLTSYVDDDPIDGVLYYRIAGVKSVPCFPSIKKKADSGPYSHSMSNSEDNRLQGTHVIYNPDVNRNLKIWPNPVTDQVNLEFVNSRMKPVMIEIADISGQILISRVVNSSDKMIYQTFDLSSLSPGVYIFQVRMENNIERGRLIME